MATRQLLETIDELGYTLASYKRQGCKGFTCSKENLDRLNHLDEWHPQPSQITRRESLDAIREDLGDCRRCPLSETRRHIVFGSGDASARLVFVGEAPGYEEDQQGQPFVGPAGQLLTKIIHAIEMTRDTVYILNVLKCRPPKNRNPQSDEVVTCSPFMVRQILAIQPDFICALGRFAAQTLLETSQPISRLRGRFYDFKGITLMPTFHPSYLLHNPDKKREVWQDMKKLMAAIKKNKH